MKKLHDARKVDTKFYNTKIDRQRTRLIEQWTFFHEEQDHIKEHMQWIKSKDEVQNKRIVENLNSEKFKLIIQSPT